MEENKNVKMFRDVTVKVEFCYEYDFVVIALKEEPFDPIKEIGECIDYLVMFVEDKDRFDDFGELILCELAALSIVEIMIMNGVDIKKKNVSRFREITNQMADLYERKNHDYGDSFGETFRKLGPISAITRITDKYNRIVSLTTKGEQKVDGEAIEDTLIDLANYAIMTVMEMREMNENPITFSQDGNFFNEKPSAKLVVSDEGSIPLVDPNKIVLIKIK